MGTKSARLSRHPDGGLVSACGRAMKLNAMSDEFDLRSFLLSIADPDERARAIREGGWAGDPEIADIEAAIALPEGGESQKLLAALRRPRPPTPKRAVQRYERLRAAWPNRYGPKRLEESELTKLETGAGPAESGQTVEGAAVTAMEIAADGTAPVAANVPAQSPRVLVFRNVAPPEPGSLEESIGRYVDEERRKGGAHKKGGSGRKHTDQPPSLTVAFDKNPFLPSRRSARSSDMTKDEALRLYKAISFAMWQYGALMTSHVIILWETFRVPRT